MEVRGCRGELVGTCIRRGKEDPMRRAVRACSLEEVKGEEEEGEEERYERRERRREMR